MNYTSGHFDGGDRFDLFYQGWLPDGQARAVLALVHGVGEHCGRYQSLVDCLVAHRYAIIGFDHRGHGRSAGRRGHVTSWREYRADVAEFLSLVSRLQPDIPIFLYGHSMGSLIVLDYILPHQAGLQGVILSGLAVEPVGLEKPHLVAIAKFMSGLWPSFPVVLGIKGEQLTRDPVLAKAYLDDPLVNRSGSARWGIEGLKTIARVKYRAHEIRLPVLLLHGEADPLNSLEGAQRFYSQITHQDKKMIVYPGTLHEPHNDLDKERVAEDICQWMEEH
jgi:alpha-beta hydrolase superfamily lysophospholipase